MIRPQTLAADASMICPTNIGQASLGTSRSVLPYQPPPGYASGACLEQLHDRTGRMEACFTECAASINQLNRQLSGVAAPHVAQAAQAAMPLAGMRRNPSAREIGRAQDGAPSAAALGASGASPKAAAPHAQTPTRSCFEANV